jgi:WD40 repeat protein
MSATKKEFPIGKPVIARGVLPRLLLVLALPAFAGPETPTPSNPADEISQLRQRLAEQTRRIDRLYDALGPELAQMEARAAALKKQAAEDEALKLETVCLLKDQGLTTRAHFSPADDTFAVVTSKETVQIFSLAGKPLRELSLPGERLTAFGYAPDGQRMLVGTRGGKVLLWNLTNRTPRQVFARRENPIWHLLWLPNPERFVVAYEKAVGEFAVFVVRLADGEPTAEFSSRWQIATYQAIAASANGTWIGALELPNHERAGYLLNSTNIEISVKLRDDDYPSGPLSIGIAPDNQTAAVGYAPYDLSLWDMPRQKELRLIKAHSNWVTTLGFSPNSRRLISGGGDSTARIWEVATGKEIGRLRVQPDGCVYVNAVGFSTDGKHVLAAAENDLVIIAKAP